MSEWDDDWGDSWGGFQESYDEEDTVDVEYTVDDQYYNPHRRIGKKIGVFAAGVFLLGAAKRLVEEAIDL